jgi:hypothetical protein
MLSLAAGMSRTRASAKAAGARFERVIADYLSEMVDDRIDRRVKRGNHDRGDISGLRIHGREIVVECKDCATTKLAEWLREAETERGNADALAAVVVSKRKGTAAPGEQLVHMTLDQLIAVITGFRAGE